MTSKHINIVQQSLLSELKAGARVVLRRFKFNRASLLLIAILSCASVAHAGHDKKIYVMPGVSWAFYNNVDGKFDKRKPGSLFMANLAVGKSLALFNKISAELELIYYNKNYNVTLPNNPNVGNTTKLSYKIHNSIALFFNGDYAFRSSESSVVPYIGAGLGLGHNKSVTKVVVSSGTRSIPMTISKTNTDLAFQGFVGFRSAVAKNLDLDCKVRIMSTGVFRGKVAKGRIYNSAVSAGLKYSF